LFKTNQNKNTDFKISENNFPRGNPSGSRSAERQNSCSGAVGIENNDKSVNPNNLLGNEKITDWDKVRDEDYPGHTNDEINLTPPASDNTATKTLCFLPPVLAADFSSRANFGHACDILIDIIKRHSTAVTTLVRAERINMVDMLSKETNVKKRHRLIYRFICNLHSLAENVNCTANVDRDFLDRLFRMAFELKLPTPLEWKEALLTPRISNNFSPDRLDLILSEITQRCRDQCDGYGIAVSVLIGELKDEMHDTLRKEPNSEAKSKIIPILRSLNNLETPARLATADENLKKSIKDIIKSHQLRLSNFNIAQSLYLADERKPICTAAIKLPVINNTTVKTDPRINLSSKKASIVISPKKPVVNNIVDLDASQNTVAPLLFTDESVNIIDETMYDDEDDGNRSTSSNYSSRFVHPSSKETKNRKSSKKIGRAHV